MYKEKRYSNRLRSSDPEFSTDSDQKTLKRIKSEPTPPSLKASIKDHRRTKSTRTKSNVKFSSDSQPDEFAVSSVQLERSPRRFRRDPSLKLKNEVNGDEIEENDYVAVKIIFQYLIMTPPYILLFFSYLISFTACNAIYFLC